MAGQIYSCMVQKNNGTFFYIYLGLFINEKRKLSTEYAKRTLIRFISRLKEEDRRFDQKK